MKILLIFAIVIVAALSAETDVAVPPEPNTNNTTAIPPTTPPTKPTTTTPSTTTTAATTTTSASTTTTPATTTHATTTAATTTSTTTTTLAPTTTAVPPKPKPGDVPILNFNVTTDKNITCIIAKMSLMFKVPYETLKNGTHVADVIVPKTATASGICGENKQSITVSWSADNSKVMDNMTIEFSKNDTSKKFMISSVTGSLAMDHYYFPDAKSNTTIYFAHTTSAFITPLEMSYKCEKKEYLNMTAPANVNDTIATFVISNLRVQAFRNTTTQNFSSAEDCDTFVTSGIVPIAVGCSLAALIIIVLIAYLIGRRRSQARGYLSMFSDRQREDEYIPMKNLSCFGQ